MKKLLKYLLILTLFPALFLSSCKEDDDVVIGGDDSFATLSTYLIANDMDLPDVLTGWIVGAPDTVVDVDAFIAAYDILDIRSAEHFTAGHIQGAVNSSLATILVDAQNTTKPILVACYTGQTASHAVVALRLSGYSTAKVLKWGMSGWNSTLSGSWLGNSGASNGAKAIGNSNWTTNPVVANQLFDYPALTTTATTGAGILEERVQTMITGGFKGVSSTDVLAAPSNYFINNFWAQADVDHYGHIAGAYRLSPLSLENGKMANINSDVAVVTYCWTGQTSSMITAYLNVLGYNALSLKFGANSMIYPSLESHQFVAPANDLPLSTN